MRRPLMITLSTALILSRRRCDSYCIELKHDLYVGVVHHGLSYTFNRTLKWSMRQVSAVVAPAKVPACQCQQVSAGCHRNRAAACARRESPSPSIKPPPPLCQPISSHKSLTLHSCTFSPVNNKVHHSRHHSTPFFANRNSRTKGSTWSTSTHQPHRPRTSRPLSCFLLVLSVCRIFSNPRIDLSNGALATLLRPLEQVLLLFFPFISCSTDHVSTRRHVWACYLKLHLSLGGLLRPPGRDSILRTNPWHMRTSSCNRSCCKVVINANNETCYGTTICSWAQRIHPMDCRIR